MGIELATCLWSPQPSAVEMSKESGFVQIGRKQCIKCELILCVNYYEDHLQGQHNYIVLIVQ